MKYLIILLTGICLTSCYQGENADTIIHNARIYSCDDGFTIYEAMAIKDGKIIQLGPEREILNGYKCDNIIDAQMKPVYPGFHDAHCHFGGYALTLSEVNLNGLSSFDRVVEKVIEFEESNEFSWIKGRGWDQTLWEGSEFPTNDTFNILFPDKPMAIRRIDGHAALVNQKALDIAGITPETIIEGGQIEVVNGKCTGLLLDNAYDSVAIHIPELEEDRLLKLMQDAQYDLFQVGLTSINDAGIESSDREKFIKWYENNQLIIKNYAMLFPDKDNMKFASDSKDYRNNNLHIRSFKIVADGALGSRGACLIHPYEDKANHSGFIVTDLKEVRSIAEFAAEIGYQVNTHCIGDSANRAVLNIYKDIIGDESDHRWKIEHAQVIAEQDFQFFENYNVIPSVQPTHCTSDMRWAEDRLGPDRVKYAYAYKLLLEKAGIVALGTDFPIENISPLETFYAAVSRQDKKGFPEDGFQVDQALSREEALLGMTIWAAYSNFENHEKGSLEPGKSADFVILTQDIMEIPLKEILNTYVERTFLDGTEVYNGVD